MNNKTKKDEKHLTYIIPNVRIQVEEISLKDIERKNYIYSTFPIMDPSLYVKIKKPKIKYQSRFEVAKDEVYKLTFHLYNYYIVVLQCK